MLGIYVHIPFCAKKCPYCDFYSLSFSKELVERYVAALEVAINSYCKDKISVNTIYFGGGTPNLIGADNVKKIIDCIKENFVVSRDSEITLEANPESFSKQDISAFAKAGINRLSMGLQSANESELKALGRRHTLAQVEDCIRRARECGIGNISLDLMLGIEGQTLDSLKKSIEFCKTAGVNHISSYLLKIEPETPYYKMQSTMSLPDDDFCAELYSFAVDELKACGFEQYEISNFAKDGAVSKHNLKYWQCEEYIGIGAAAHGFYKGERYFYPRDINAFMENPTETISDGVSGIEEEFMLALRLSCGVCLSDLCKKYNVTANEKLIKKIDFFCDTGLMQKSGERIRITPRGFLVSNSIISDLILAWGL